MSDREVLTARIVLQDAELACSEIASADEVSWRLRWVCTLTLLRAVGHVLSKVDRPRFAAHRDIFDSWWTRLSALKQKGEPHIFWDFIEDERNSVLKTYSFQPDPNTGPPIEIGNSGLGFGAPGEWVVLPGHRFLMQAGPFEAQSGLALAQQACRWWQEQLLQIEQKLATSA